MIFRLSLLALSLFSFPVQASVPCARPWLFFDTGNVLVDSSDFAHMHYTPEAVSYLREAKMLGYRLGLIVNIPAEWGNDERTKKLALRKFIADNWSDETPFSWKPFSVIFIPLNDDERKPAPVMFERALNRAKGCEALYQGEDPAEIATAKKVGLHTYQVGVKDRPFFMPLKRVASILARQQPHQGHQGHPQ